MSVFVIRCDHQIKLCVSLPSDVANCSENLNASEQLIDSVRQVRSHVGAFVPPQIVLCPENFVLNIQ